MPPEIKWPRVILVDFIVAALLLTAFNSGIFYATFVVSLLVASSILSILAYAGLLVSITDDDPETAESSQTILLDHFAFGAPFLIYHIATDLAFVLLFVNADFPVAGIIKTASMILSSIVIIQANQLKAEQLES